MSALRQPTPPDPPSVTALPATSREVLGAIRAAYTFVDSADERAVMSILATRPDVAAILLDALPHVEAIFDKDTPILLVGIDYHTEEPLGLAALIEATGTVSERLAKQQRLYREWWLSVPSEIVDVLSFSV